jgi:hypothetical protein
MKYLETLKTYCETQGRLADLRERIIERREATIQAQSDMLEGKDRDIAELVARVQAKDVLVEEHRAETGLLKKQLEEANKAEEKMRRMQDALKLFMAAVSE